MAELATVGESLPDVFRTPSRQDTDSWVDVVAAVVRLAETVAGTDFVPKGIRDSVPATAAAMLYGREVGLPPMTALSQTIMVDGKPGMYAEAQRALVLAAGHELVYDELSGAVCRMRGRRAGEQRWTTIEWSIDMARAAGLLRNPSWQKFPRAMLAARCTTELCRLVFPDVIHGFRSVEELQDMDYAVAGGTSEPAETGGTTTVKRRRRVTKKAAPAAIPPPDEPRPPIAPPLPGDMPQSARGGAETAAGVDYENGTPAAKPAVTPPDTETAGTPVAAGVTPTETPARRPEPPVFPPEPDEPETPGPRMIGVAQRRVMFRELNRLGIGDEAHRRERLAVLLLVTGRELTSSNELTHEEAQRVTMILTGARDLDELRRVLGASGDTDPVRRPVPAPRMPPDDDPPHEEDTPLPIGEDEEDEP